MTALTASHRAGRDVLAGRRILIVGLGGLGCPAALALLDSGATLVLADDDLVEATNLHRQILFEDADVGLDKVSAAGRALRARGLGPDRLELVQARLLPENGRELVRSVDLVLEGADNYATKFLAADCALLERRPIVHGAAVRWVATAFAVGPRGQPCYRCLFEDVPAGAQQNCAVAGVVGPVVGLGGALMAELAFRVLTGDGQTFESISTYDGQRDRLRRIGVRARSGCTLCGSNPQIFEIEERRYTAPSCAA